MRSSQKSLRSSYSTTAPSGARYFCSLSSLSAFGMEEVSISKSSEESMFPLNPSLLQFDLHTCERFERELEALRKEIAESSARTSSTSGSSTPGTLSRGSSSTDLPNLHARSESYDSLNGDEAPFITEPISEHSPPIESKKDLWCSLYFAFVFIFGHSTFVRL